MSPDPGEELGEAERFRDVVIGTSVETDDDVDFAMARGEDDDREGRMVGADPTAYLVPVEVRESEVEDHELRRVRRSRVERSLAGGRPVDDVALRSERAGEGASDRLVVLHEEDGRGIHGFSVGVRDAERQSCCDLFTVS
jgi:hypothetical protein